MKTLIGMVDEVLGVKTGTGKKGNWTLTVFRLKAEDGSTHKVQTFNEFDKDLVGQWIQIAVDYDEQYAVYKTDNSAISVLANAPASVGGTATAVADEPETACATKAVPRAKRSYEKNPKAPSSGNSIPTTTYVPDNAGVAGELESVRANAEAIVSKDLLFARGQLGPSASADAAATLVSALQAVRATLFIEANKRDRVADMKGRK